MSVTDKCGTGTEDVGSMIVSTSMAYTRILGSNGAIRRFTIPRADSIMDPSYQRCFFFFCTFIRKSGWPISITSRQEMLPFPLHRAGRNLLRIYLVKQYPL